MSMEKHTYLIVGYDLSQYKDEILTEEFCQSSVYDDLTCCKCTGQVQIFDNDSHLYFGYIVGYSEEYGCCGETIMNFGKYLEYSEVTSEKLKQFISQDIISSLNGDANLIMFHEWY